MAARRKARPVGPDTGILCLRILALTNNMVAVTSRDSSVTGRFPLKQGLLSSRVTVGGVIPVYRIEPPTRMHSPPVSVCESRTPVSAGLAGTRNSPSPERNT